MVFGTAGIQTLPSDGDQAVLAVFPCKGRAIARLARLSDPVGRCEAPVVTVVGKYNHGKSRLLNELLGDDAFVVADRRATTPLSAYRCQGMRWLDAPGLASAVNIADDTLAEERKRGV